MEPLIKFKRMVLGLPHSTKDYVSVAFAAELANLWGLDLIGIFAEDEELANLAILPCVREFCFANDGWHRLDAEQLTRSSSQAIGEARRLFHDAARSLRIAARFDLVKGQIGKAVGEQTRPNDIVVVIEPKSAVERFSYQFRQFVDMALNAPFATLLVPSRIRRHKGPVVVIAMSEHDVSIEIGLRLAETVRERLLVLAPDFAAEALSARFSGRSAVHVEQRLLPTMVMRLAELEAILATTSERLVVMSRGADNLFPAQLASERGVPVLVIAQGQQLSQSAG